MAKQPETDPQLLKELGDQAAERYRSVQNHVALMKERIKAQRRGLLTLVEVGGDPGRLDKRLAREESMGLPDALERVNGVPDFQDVSIIRRLLRSSVCVCRVLIGSSTGQSGFGTGFLVAPDVLLTNHHVLPSASVAARSIAQFNYELDVHGRDRVPISFQLKPGRLFLTSTVQRVAEDPISGLDFTLVAVEPTGEGGAPLDQFGHVRLDGSLGKIIEGENCVVIQHPKGDYKKIVLKDIRMVTVTEDALIYESDTHPGSSGAMVLGLGTGEVVALHHSAVPRTNERGEWIRKDGNIWRPGDGEDTVDWVGNEGIRVSRIVDAIRRAELPDGMDEIRRSILDIAATPPRKLTKTTPAMPVPNDPEPDVMAPVRNERAPTRTPQGYELLLSDDPRLRDAWEAQATTIVPQLVSTRPLFPGSTDPDLIRAYYMEASTADDPWAFAARVEALPHVVACTPDLPMLTDAAGYAGPSGEVRTVESAVGEIIYNDGTAEPNEDEFFKRWGHVPLIQDLRQKDLHRQWNWSVAGWNGPDKLPTDIVANLAALRFVQLDTGFSRHSKVLGGYDLTRDRDFIGDDDEAQDDRTGWGLRFPGHGIRTASITIGGRMPGNALDGNLGLLSDARGHALAKLIPYRISRSVVLIGRAVELVDAVDRAIGNGTDVMFMCMGSYPRDMIAQAAKRAYVNGVIWVCAAGNQVRMVVAPALYPGTIAVAAVNPERNPWKGSCRGPQVDVSAPGEDVYVPNWNDRDAEIMCYGNGTSYATPHVAAAAMLWKATHRREIGLRYPRPWQVVEAFRHCLTNSVAPHPDTANAGNYGKGILNINALLAHPLPKADELINAYDEQPIPQPKDLGDRELLHALWTGERSGRAPGTMESLTQPALSARARMALEAKTGAKRPTPHESLALSAKDRSTVLEELFKP